MWHPDENTLELFVLADPKGLEEFRRIKVHLDTCEGCRALVHTMKKFYEDADKEYQRKEMVPLIENNAIIPSHSDIITLFEPEVPVQTQRQFSILKKIPRPMQRFAQLHPYVTGFSSVSLIAAIIIAFILTIKASSDSPAYVHHNHAAQKIEVYDKDNKMLWNIPANLGDRSPEIEKTAARTTTISDLNNDGKYEVITSLPVGEDRSSSNLINIYDTNAKLIRSIQLNYQILNFHSNHYETPYNISNFVIDDFLGKNKKSLIAFLTNSRSPFLIVHINSDGEILGEFYHFGCLHLPFVSDVNDDGLPELILGGVNDVSDYENGRFVTIDVINPRKLIGKAESVCTRGFGLPPSNAELFYLRIPYSDIDLATDDTPDIGRAEIDNSGIIHIIVQSMKNRAILFEYIFSRDVKPLEVKGGIITYTIHKKLKAEGKISSTFDQEYFDSLRKSVLYWNGIEWVAKPMGIDHSLAPRQQ